VDPALPESALRVEQVVQLPGKSQLQVYQGVKLWLAETFRSAKAVIELDDKQAGVVVGNGIIDYPCEGVMNCVVGANGWRVAFSMRIEMKDQKARVTFSGLRLLIPAQPGIHGPMDNPIYRQSDMDKVRAGLLRLADGMGKAIVAVEPKTSW
jgi:hypothetical protein